MGMDSVHGETYEWIPDFFKFNHINANMTMARIVDDYPGLTIIEHPELVRVEDKLLQGSLFLPLRIIRSALLSACILLSTFFSQPIYNPMYLDTSMAAHFLSA